MRNSVSSAKELLERFYNRFTELVPLIRGGSRTEVQMDPLIEAMQCVIDDQPFNVVPSVDKDLLLSHDPDQITRGWRQLFRKWGFEGNYVTPIPFNTTFIESEAQQGRIPIFVPESFNSNMSVKLERAINGYVSIDWKGVVHTGDEFGWAFVSSSPETPNTTEEELVDWHTKALDMNLLAFTIFFGLCQEIYPGKVFNTTQIEHIPQSFYGLPLINERKRVFVRYDSFQSFMITEIHSSYPYGSRSYFTHPIT